MLEQPWELSEGDQRVGGSSLVQALDVGIQSEGLGIATWRVCVAKGVSVGLLNKVPAERESKTQNREGQRTRRPQPGQVQGFLSPCLGAQFQTLWPHGGVNPGRGLAVGRGTPRVMLFQRARGPTRGHSEAER